MTFPDVETTNGLRFSDLRAANKARLPLFKNRRGEPAHSKPDGSDWCLAQWCNAVTGELGEAANLIKKVERGDMTLDEARADLAKELADVQTYLDILAFRAGIDLGAATESKFNEVSARVGCNVRLAPSQPAPAEQASPEPIVLTGPEDCIGVYSRNECSVPVCPTPGECFQRNDCLKPAANPVTAVPSEAARKAAEIVMRSKHDPLVVVIGSRALNCTTASLACDAVDAVRRDITTFAEQHAADAVRERDTEIARLRKALTLISIVEQGAGGNLTFQEMAESAMRQAKDALRSAPTGEAAGNVEGAR